jgi:hypothetical protein
MRIDCLRTFMFEKVASARKYIYALAKPISGANVENLLKEFSGVPTMVCAFIQIFQLFNLSILLSI